MSNISPRPVFIPTPGKPKPASPPDRYDSKGWPIWFGGLTVQQVKLREERLILDREKRAERRERLGKLCRTCKGRSVAWRIGRCPTCLNSGRRM